MYTTLRLHRKFRNLFLNEQEEQRKYSRADYLMALNNTLYCWVSFSIPVVMGAYLCGWCSLFVSGIVFNTYGYAGVLRLLGGYCFQYPCLCRGLFLCGWRSLFVPGIVFNTYGYGCATLIGWVLFSIPVVMGGAYAFGWVSFSIPMVVEVFAFE